LKTILDGYSQAVPMRAREFLRVLYHPEHKGIEISNDFQFLSHSLQHSGQISIWALIRKSWLIQKKSADLRYERKGFIALLAPAYLPAGRQVCG
jgi:hypothetical protein